MNRIARGVTCVALLACVLTESLAAQQDDSQRKNYWVPAIEVPAFLVALNATARVLYPHEMQDGERVYVSTWQSSWDHLRKENWVFDRDPFNVNQFSHPYLGATMFGFPRSAGLGFWPSLVYSDAGSFLWEMAGETTRPSVNDIIMTGQAGSLLGEALFRIAASVEGGPDANAKVLRGLAADLIDPERGLNHHILGIDARTGLSPTEPALAWQLGVGFAKDALAHDYSNPTSLQRDATIEYSMSYGIPGKSGYRYGAPLSYFDLHVSALFDRNNPIESVTLRGLLLGGRTSSSETSPGIWGLYGSYDYISPYLFRVSSAALSLGTTRQDWLSDAVALQASLLGGVGYGAAGNAAGIPSTTTTEAQRDYHYGVTPQALAAVRLSVADRVLLDGTARGYYVSGVGSDDAHGSETIFRGNAGVSVRLFGGHTLGAQLVSSTRNAKYGTLPDRKFNERTWSVSYAYVGSGHFSGGQSR